jgi:hypothetical protein
MLLVSLVVFVFVLCTYVASFSGFSLSSSYVHYVASFSGFLYLRLVYPMLLVSLDCLCLRLMYPMLLVSLVFFVFFLCTLCC